MTDFRGPFPNFDEVPIDGEPNTRALGPSGHRLPMVPERADASVGVDDRPTMQVRGGGLAQHTADAEVVLATATAASPMTGIYARGSLLVRPVRLRHGSDTGGVRHAPGSLQLLRVEADYLRLELTRLVHLTKYDKRTKSWGDVDAPEALARSVLAAVPWPVLPKLAGIIEAPTLRDDGTLLDRPGYDKSTGLLFDPGGAIFPKISPRPSREDAEAALATLGDILRDFPFADDPSRSVAHAALITGLVRRPLRAAPLFAFSAPKMASGKTLLATLASYLATGRPPAMLSQSDDPESERKRLLALLMEGTPMIVLDNIERALKSDSLCSILTEPVFADRVLGLSRTASVPTNATFLATGNNIIIHGDLTTRALVCTLDPKVERPEERHFGVNLHEVVPARRGELVAAALTIPLAYLAAGASPQNIVPFGRFECWARLCRDPLVWLGEADPCATRSRIESRDPVRENLRALLTSWSMVFGTDEVTVAAAVRLMAEGEKYDALRNAFEAVASKGREIDTRKLGTFISNHEGRIEAGLRFERYGERSGVSLWRVVP